jgi:probable HAF family extracellular repeat protein
MKILGLLALFSGLTWGSTIYSISDLGGLGSSSSGAGYQINDAGAVVGWAESVTGNQQAFVSMPGGSHQNLQSPGASDSYAFGINGENVIVGVSYINGQPHGTIWSGSTVTDLGAGVFATAINASGTIVGSNGHAFKMVNGTYQDLGTLPGGSWSAAYGVNDSGTAVGYGDLASGLFRAMVWNPNGSVTQLGTLGGANSYATAVNNGGEVIGHAGTASGYEHAFLEMGGVMQDLGTLDGGCSYAYGINDSGSIVGYSWSQNESDPRAFLYAGGAMQDLNGLIGSGTGWQLLEAYGINATGEITGVGLLNGQPSAFLLQPTDPIAGAAPDPVPEPRSLSVILLSMSLVVTLHRRGRMRYRN